jgi:MoaA/NifB/PqqE/SkfB family radical SAM enzyme
MLYRVTYRILPAGTGPDDYEPADLEAGEVLVDLDDPEPVGVISGGDVLAYGPHIKDVEKAVHAAANLKPGDEPIIRTWDPA